MKAKIAVINKLIIFESQNLYCNLPIVLDDIMGALGAGAGAEVLAAHCRFKEPGKYNNRIKSYSIWI